MCEVFFTPFEDIETNQMMIWFNVAFADGFPQQPSERGRTIDRRV